MYSIIFLLIIISLLLLLLFKLFNGNRNYFMCILITFFIFLFVSNLRDCIDAALVGVSLVIKTIVPTIFPFSVICNLLISYDGVWLYSKILGPIFCKPLKLSKQSSFPIVASILSGYPLGCKYCCDIKLGFILLISNYLTPIIVGILTIKNSKTLSNMKEIKSNSININFGTSLKYALDNGVNTTLQVGSFVVLFSIIISIIKNNAYVSIIFSNIEAFFNLPQYSLYGIFLGSIEFTNGCKLITTLPLTMPFKLAIISFICSFSGLSVIAQISSFISKYNVSIIKYSLYKLLQGIISFIITFIISSIFIFKYTTYTSTFVSINNNISLVIYLLILLVLICTLTIAVYKKLHTS